MTMAKNVDLRTPNLKGAVPCLSFTIDRKGNIAVELSFLGEPTCMKPLDNNSQHHIYKQQTAKARRACGSEADVASDTHTKPTAEKGTVFVEKLHYHPVISSIYFCS